MTGVVSTWLGGVFLVSSTLAAVDVGSHGDAGNPWQLMLQHVIAAGIFALMGVAVFAAGIWLFVKLSPFCVRKEIEEDQNTALAVIMGAVLLGLSIIIAAAILG